MIDTRAPVLTSDLGLLAYVAYWRVLAPLCLPWDQLSAAEQHAWRRAAQAVQRGALGPAIRRTRKAKG